VKYCFLTLAAGSVIWAQSARTTYTTDLNGHRVESATSTSNSEQSELTRSINGRQVPLEKSEERVIREDPSSKVTEKIVRKYDPNGQLSSTERQVTEEQKLPGGGSKTRTTTFQSDINGQMRESARVSTEVHPQGSTTNTETVIERPTINGAFQVMEKRSATAQATGDSTHEDETVYRRSENGNLYPAVRQVTDQSKSQDQTQVNTAYYEPGVTGQMQLARQSKSVTRKAPDGSEITEVDLYGKAVPGNVNDNQTPQQLQEQQMIQRRKGPGDSVVETLSIRRPTQSDVNRLGPLQQISETVCTGKCESAPAKPEAKP
jgi:hypothetical protein